ncbi:uncharacterized protein LOC102806612 [Saccoglossus kowalevskii]|uniref:Centrosomal protein of 85 kDa-like n=1 Tax=Saccoglossus kowalevskii TaxID=10224 RepID=A0ABM0LZC5_SACKO|nr:PREDICTED: centrosomal protein of 85 kDa-like [Saccoglossus kowalevskii]
MQIHHMQEELRKRESGRLQMVGLNHGDEVIKMQEYQYETAALKAHIAELASSQNTDIHQMSTRLGQTEYELEETQTALKQLALAKKREADLLQKQINEKEEQLDEWTNKFQLFNDKYDKLKNRNDTLERYLEDLPTVEDTRRSRMN